MLVRRREREQKTNESLTPAVSCLVKSQIGAPMHVLYSLAAVSRTIVFLELLDHNE
jgi:hypothetical protein